MSNSYADITDLSYLDLCVPADGTLAVVAEGSNYWAPAEGDPAARDSASEQWLEMQYEPVLSMDGKLVDVVAWAETNPSQWWVRTGRCLVLGAPELMRVTFTDLPMYLVSTPAGYRHLRDSPQQLESVCILNWRTVDTKDLFQANFGAIFCLSDTLLRRLAARHKECGGDPLLLAVDPDPLDYSVLRTGA